MKLTLIFLLILINGFTAIKLTQERLKNFWDDLPPCQKIEVPRGN